MVSSKNELLNNLKSRPPTCKCKTTKKQQCLLLRRDSITTLALFPKSVLTTLNFKTTQKLVF